MLTALPIIEFKKNTRFYLAYDGLYLALCVAIMVSLKAVAFEPLFGAPSWTWALAFPLVLFALIWAHLLIHNATHGSWPAGLSRIAGEILGFCVVVRFASWDIVHMRHHAYSDDRVKDPHPNFQSYWKTVWNTIVMVEQQLQQEYFDVWGDTPENHKKERIRAWVSYGTNIALVGVWLMVLGWPFVLLVFGPANLLAGLFVIHFNWSTHNGERGTQNTDFRPVNLNSGYYKWGNKFFCGIYMHANHHTRPSLFNPAKWDAARLGTPEQTVDAR